MLLVLMSITENAGISWQSVLDAVADTVDRLTDAPRYPGEEFDRTAMATKTEGQS